MLRRDQTETRRLQIPKGCAVAPLRRWPMLVVWRQAEKGMTTRRPRSAWAAWPLHMFLMPLFGTVDVASLECHQLFTFSVEVSRCSIDVIPLCDTNHVIWMPSSCDATGDVDVVLERIYSKLFPAD